MPLIERDRDCQVKLVEYACYSLLILLFPGIPRPGANSVFAR
jgi:hypothetical protein